jgi:type II secretory pathway component PulL
VFAVWAEWANIAGTVMHKTVSDHFVLPLETLSSFRTCTSWNGAVMWSRGRMNVRMRAINVRRSYDKAQRLGGLTSRDTVSGTEEPYIPDEHTYIHPLAVRDAASVEREPAASLVAASAAGD